MAVPNLGVQLPYAQLGQNAAATAGIFNSNPAQAAAALGPAYQANYQGALGINAALDQGIQTGYGNLRSGVDQQYADITQGYHDLYGDVLGRIAGTNSSNIQDINTQYNALQGSAVQNNVSRGLGSSSSALGAQRAIELDRARAVTGSQNQFAQLGAGYANQIGQAGLGAQQQGVQTGANLGVDQLRYLQSISAPYPNAQMYSQLAQQYGATNEANRNRAAQQAAIQPPNAAAGMISGGGGAGRAFGGTGSFAPLPNLNPGGISGSGYAGTSGFYSGGSGVSPGQNQLWGQGYSGDGYQPSTMDAGGGDVGYGGNQGQNDQYGYGGDPGSQGAGYYGDYGDYYGG